MGTRGWSKWRPPGSPVAASAERASPEEAFRSTVVQLASWNGWKAYHTHDSRRSDSGFPDQVFARGPRLIAAELKAGRGVTTEAQREWLTALAATGVEAVLWRPDAAPGAERWDGTVETLEAVGAFSLGAIEARLRGMTAALPSRSGST